MSVQTLDPGTLHEQLMLYIDQQVRRSPRIHDSALHRSTETLKAELSRLETALARLSRPDHRRVDWVLRRELGLIVHMFTVMAADLITEPMREDALRQGDERILDDALALFNALTGRPRTHA